MEIVDGPRIGGRELSAPDIRFTKHPNTRTVTIEALSFRGSIWLLKNVTGTWSHRVERVVPGTAFVEDFDRLTELAKSEGLTIETFEIPRR
jgi:hypothetical protein